jgi:hypothetical protein
MADPITRPVFYEGQILAAADLQAGIDHAAGQQARHERYLHSWGIASGLALAKTDATAVGGKRYVQVTVRAGVAIDGTGREIVVPNDTPLSEADFFQSNVHIGFASAVPPAMFPVF